jgi:hypothetical protein
MKELDAFLGAFFLSRLASDDGLGDARCGHYDLVDLDASADSGQPALMIPPTAGTPRPSAARVANVEPGAIARELKEDPAPPSDQGQRLLGGSRPGY